MHNDDGLRYFKNVDDLFDAGQDDPGNDWNAQILVWVNELASIRPKYKRLVDADEKRREYHKKHQMKNKLLIAAAKTLLQQDEQEALAARAEEALTEQEIERA
jgi:predicted carbohydrate-binding protein with CBM5 and CBM33 domain